jgi:hypothetical protein
MAVITSYAGEAMRPEGVEPRRRLWIPAAAFHDEYFRGANEYDDWKQSMTC